MDGRLKSTSVSNRAAGGQPAISVLYDVSALSYGITWPAAEGGISRVILNWVTQTASCPDIDARLFCPESWIAEAEVAGYLDERKSPLRRRLLPVWRTRLPEPFSSLHTGDALRNRTRRRLYRDLLGRYAGLHASISMGKEARRKIHRAALSQIVTRDVPAGSFDIYHSLWAALPRRGEVAARARILTVYDLIPILAEEAYPRTFVNEFKSRIQAVDIHREWVICISENTKKDFCAYTGMDSGRVFVAPLAASKRVFYHVDDERNLAAIRAKYGIPSAHYILSVSSVHRRKGSIQLAKAFGRLMREGQLADESLVLVGSQYVTREELVSASGLNGRESDRIIVPGRAADADLAAIYSGASVCAFLSVYEGFGLPALEALQCGAPLIASDTSSLPEVVDDAGILVGPTDEDAICAAILKISRDDDLRRRLSRLGRERAKQFSWEASGEALVSAYRAALA